MVAGGPLELVGDSHDSSYVLLSLWHGLWPRFGGARADGRRGSTLARDPVAVACAYLALSAVCSAWGGVLVGGVYRAPRESWHVSLCKPRNEQKKEKSRDVIKLCRKPNSLNRVIFVTKCDP